MAKGPDLVSAVVMGQEIIFCQWNGDGHTEFPAIIRAIQGDADQFPDVNLTYDDGSSSGDENSVANIESLASINGEDYWRRKTGIPQPFDKRYRDLSTSQSYKGKIIWYLKYNPDDMEHYPFVAVVQAVIGNPNQDHPTVNLMYIDPDDGSKVNVNQIDPVEEITFPTTGDFWADR